MLFKRVERWSFEGLSEGEVIIPTSYAKVESDLVSLPDEPVRFIFYTTEDIAPEILEDMEDIDTCIFGLHDGCGELLQKMTFIGVEILDKELIYEGNDFLSAQVRFRIDYEACGSEA